MLLRFQLEMERSTTALSLFAASALGLFCACGECPQFPTVESTDPFYERFEAPGFANACATDADCTRSGCSGEVCAAVDVVTTCEALPERPEGTCGCADGECRWHRPVCGPSATPR
jgi:eight-cysteine-cluster-containing protein